MGNERMRLVEAQYQDALLRVAVRLTLIVSISAMAQLVSYWLGN